MATNIGNYLIEVDGVAVCRASECETGGTKHEPFEVYHGDQPMPSIGRGKYKVEEVKIKQAYGIGNEGAEFVQQFQDYITGANVGKLNIRVVTLDEDGVAELATDDYIDCVPTSFVPDAKKGEGKEAAYFSIAFRPTDHIPAY